MKRRHLLHALTLAGTALPLWHRGATAATATTLSGPALLTVTGAISRPNRGPFDPVRDQMMHKQKLGFDNAHAFDFAALTALPAISIRPTLEYDSRQHALRGPLLADVVQAAGGAGGDGVKLVLRAVDGYAATVPLATVRAQRWIVATHLDGAPMALGGLGPLWAIYDADRVPEMAHKPLPERYGSCPWALYHIEVS